jgi:hypothetical protein
MKGQDLIAKMHKQGVFGGLNVGGTLFETPKGKPAWSIHVGPSRGSPSCYWVANGKFYAERVSWGDIEPNTNLHFTGDEIPDVPAREKRLS